MSGGTLEELKALSGHLELRRDAILRSCRAAAFADPVQTTVAALTRTQFNDHLPQVLDAFERKLSAGSEGNRIEAGNEQKQEEMKHGLHRWQQGYRLRELLHEWGHLHLCLFNEIMAFAAAHPNLGGDTLVVANCELIKFVNEAVSESAGQYARLQQDEAAGHARDLQKALDNVSEIERRRTKLIHQAVHDLRGNLQSVHSAAEVLRDTEIAAAERAEFLDSVQHGTEVLSSTLEELMALARLEAGEERREIAPFDAAKLIAELCTVTRPFAAKSGLYLKGEGPSPLPVDGDAAKVRRIAQNLLLNGLKYTESGGVTLHWGEEGKGDWWFIVEDTGPGILAGPGAPIVTGLKEATVSAQESEKNAPGAEERPAPAAKEPPEAPVRPPQRQQPGEGIGLSIVKRLCDLLDARLELASSPERGTTFRVVLPRRYH